MRVKESVSEIVCESMRENERIKECVKMRVCVRATFLSPLVSNLAISYMLVSPRIVNENSRIE